MDMDVPFSTIMGVKNWKWLVFHSRHFRNSDVGTQNMPRRKRTDWPCPPLGRWVPLVSLIPRNTPHQHSECTCTGTHMNKHKCHTYVHECGNAGTHTHVHIPAQSTYTEKELEWGVPLSGSPPWIHFLLFLMANCFRIHYCTIRKLFFGHKSFKN